ncbi:MAG: peptidase S10 [Alphaproteobacteria bacterium]|nr:MAG: peptidase S10 [Alphaproteobacteria bacterium]
MNFRNRARAAALLLMTLPLAAPAVVADAGAEPQFPAVQLALPTSKHLTGTFHGKAVSYSATMAKTPVADADGKPGAELVSFAYVADGTRAAADRPVMFVFNGGPIVSAQYLHMGLLGPKRVAFDDDITTTPAAYSIVDNDLSILDVADLVFVDPASTGFSRVVDGKDFRDYFSVKADAQQVAAFIATWLKDNERTNSPLYVFGESYGTMRAPEVVGQLAAMPEPILADGVILFGQAANIIEYAQRPANIISYVASLPTLTATGWYHGKVKAGKGGIDALLSKSRAFANGEYLQALFDGNSISPARKKSVAKKLEALSGIPADYYLAHDLRISKEEYRQELLKDQKLLLGRADARYTAPITDKGRAPDPSGVLSNALQDEFRTYLGATFGIQDTSAYMNAAPVKGLGDWDWGAAGGPFADFPYQKPLNMLMEKNPKFRVMVSNGYYDTQTTMGAAEYLVKQAGWPKDRTELKYYPGGHMAYTIGATAVAVTDDLRAFVGGK